MDPAYGRGKRESVTTRTAVEYFCTLSQTPGGQCLGNLFVLSGEYNGKVCCACMQTDKVLGWSAPPGGPGSAALRTPVSATPPGLPSRSRRPPARAVSVCGSGSCDQARARSGRTDVKSQMSPRREMTQSRVGVPFVKPETDPTQITTRAGTRGVEQDVRDSSHVWRGRDPGAAPGGDSPSPTLEPRGTRRAWCGSVAL